MAVYYPTFIISILVLIFITYYLIKGLRRGKLLIPLDASSPFVLDHFVKRKEKVAWLILILVYIVLYVVFTWMLIKSI